LERANAIAKQADIIAALSLEVLKGSTKAFDIGKCKISCQSLRALIKCKYNVLRMLHLSQSLGIQAIE
jgi:histidine ammonia-lyase